MSSEYKALFTADWQLCNNLPYAKPSKQEGVTDRLLDQVAVVRQIGALAEKHEVDGIYVLGDIYERRLLDAVTLRYGVELMLELAEIVDVFILPGNHDANSTKGGRFTLEMFEVLKTKGLMYLGGSKSIRSKPKSSLVFYPMPWCPTGMAMERLEHLNGQREPNEHNVLLLHHPILGCKDGEWTCDAGLDAAIICDGWDEVFSGHFHERQSFGKCGEFIGAPMEHDQRDANSKGPRGVKIKSWKKGEQRSSFVPITSPRFYTFDWDELKKTGEVANPGDYVRVGVTATHAEWIVRYAEAEEWAKDERKKGTHVEIYHKPIYQHAKRLDVGKAPSTDKVLSSYVEMAETEGLDKDRLLTIGKAILEEVSNG